MDQPVIIRTPSPELQPGRQWSKAALLLGCFLIFLFPVMVAAVVAGAALGALSTPVVDVPTLRVYIFLGRLAVYCLMGAAALAVTFGLLGLRPARSRNRPMGLAVAGMSLAVIALLLQVLLLVLFGHITEDMIRVKKEWYDPAFQKKGW
jgi:hypothetical protein